MVQRKNNRSASLDRERAGEDNAVGDQPLAPSSAWRFGLGRMMLVMTVLCAIGAGMSYMASALRSQGGMRMVFVLFSLAAPVLLLVLMSVLYQLTAIWRKHQAKPKKRE